MHAQSLFWKRIMLSSTTAIAYEKPDALSIEVKQLRGYNLHVSPGCDLKELCTSTQPGKDCAVKALHGAEYVQAASKMLCSSILENS
eukprot:scaffold67278_cov22-Tisochrysis_lutea.AAC.5